MVYFECNFPVRYYETDQMGIVHHSNYIRYFECARTLFMREIGYTIEKCEEDGVVMPVVSVECKYKYSAKMGDMLRVVAKIKEVPLAKLVVEQEVYNQDGRLCACGKVIVGFMEKDSGKLVACPPLFASLIQNRINDR